MIEYRFTTSSKLSDVTVITKKKTPFSTEISIFSGIRNVLQEPHPVFSLFTENVLNCDLGARVQAEPGLWGSLPPPIQLVPHATNGNVTVQDE